MPRSHLVSAVAIGLTLASTAAAQPTPPPRGPTPVPATPAPTGTAPAPGPGAPTTARAVEVDDPLLAVPPAAPRTLASWRDALTLIASRSTDLYIAQQEVDHAAGVTRQALGRALPQADLRGSVTVHLIRKEVSSFDPDTGKLVKEKFPESPVANAQITVSQPILAPRIWYAVGTARRQEKVAQLRVDDEQRTIVLTVANAIVAVVTAERVAEINRVGLKGALERLELTQRRQRLGAGSTLDVVRAQQDVELARSTLVNGDEGLRQAREALGLSLGYGEPYGVSPAISLNEIEESTRAICAPAPIDQRADILAAKAAQEVAERGVTDAKLGWAPSAEVSTTAGASTSKDAPFSWSIQAVLTVPIWDGGSRYGEIRSAKATAREQKARVDVAVRGATIESVQAMRGVTLAEQQRTLSERSRDLAKETARLAAVAFEAGAGTSFNLVDSGRKAREAELNLALKEFDVVKARLAALLAASQCRP